LNKVSESIAKYCEAKQIRTWGTAAFVSINQPELRRYCVFVLWGLVHRRDNHNKKHAFLSRFAKFGYLYNPLCPTVEKKTPFTKAKF
jgi:hypothetical protein